jgi:hypothetical protein
MQDPDSPPKHELTCPTCNRPVEPGNKFCATCGTKIPALLTCSKCGTQFIHPSEYCHLCGAPLILAEEPEPDESPEIPEEEKKGPAEDQTPGQDEEEVPEPDTDEVPDEDQTPEQDEEEVPEPDTDEVPDEDQTPGQDKEEVLEPDTEEVPDEDQTPGQDEEEVPEPDTDEVPEEQDRNQIAPAHHTTPHHYNKEIQEPDTDELLEEYGKDYEEDESLESLHKPKKPVKVPAPRERGSPETVDDVLFLSPKKPESPAKLPVNKVLIIGGCVVLIAIVAAVYFIGLPMLRAHYNPPVAEITPTPGQTILGTIPTTQSGISGSSSGALVPQTIQIPPGPKLYFQVGKDPVTSRITVIFAGSADPGSFRSAEVKVTHPDGSVSTGMILPLKGVNEIILAGSKETDRVEIMALMSDSKTYRVYDELVRQMGV